VQGGLERRPIESKCEEPGRLVLARPVDQGRRKRDGAPQAASQFLAQNSNEIDSYEGVPRDAACNPTILMGHLWYCVLRQEVIRPLRWCSNRK